MKTSIATPRLADKRWIEGKRKLLRLFTHLTGYDIMFEESRKDLTSEKRLAVLQTAKKRITEIEKMNFHNWKR